MKKINLAISGCLGRMGQQLIKSSRNNKNFKLAALTENKAINKKIAGIKLDMNTEQAFRNTDVIIDFTVPSCTLDILKIASKLKKRVVIGTTGFNQKEEALIKKFSKTIPILKAGNMSLGVNLLMYLTEIVSKSLNDEYLSKVFEVHHKHKKDYPSGTALMLGKGIADGKNKNFYNFFGKKFFQWALLLPAAVPAYIIAYTYTDFLEYAGPVQKILREFFNFQNSNEYWFPEIRSMEGAIFVMSFVLYPYVYMTTRASFLTVPISFFQTSLIYGRRIFKYFKS